MLACLRGKINRFSIFFNRRKTFTIHFVEISKYNNNVHCSNTTISYKCR